MVALKLTINLLKHLYQLVQKFSFIYTIYKRIHLFELDFYTVQKYSH